MNEVARRQFLHFLASSPLVGPELLRTLARTDRPQQDAFAELKNVFELKAMSDEKLEPIASRYLNGGADDLKTVEANRAGFDEFQIRPRRLVDVSRVDTSIELFGEKHRTPILLAPVGFLNMFDESGELAVARAAGKGKHQFLVSTVSSYAITDIAAESQSPPWFQLYPTPDREITKRLIELAADAGCPVMALTVDTPVIGNREDHAGYLTSRIASGELAAGNLVKLGVSIKSLPDPTLDWTFIQWLRNRWSGKILLKGIVTHEDSRLAVEHGVDGIIVSNHGGRQLESNRSTIECLPEVVEVASKTMPVLIDGGFRRGTDIFKAIALGAKAICVGRPYLWGLAAYGQAGVERALELLSAELVLDMQLAGTPSIADITSAYVKAN